MPKITLKPNSPEFQDPKKDIKLQPCDVPGCAEQGEHKAPKHRVLDEYYSFCIDHVRAYNQAWNYFEGMHPNEVEEQMVQSLYGDRPTWRYDTDASKEKILHRKAWQTYHFTEEAPQEKVDNGTCYSLYGIDKNSPEFEALSILGLEPPLTADSIKSRYKILVKKHHPDLNQGDPKSEELLKQINMSYTILMVALERFEQIDV